MSSDDIIQLPDRAALAREAVRVANEAAWSRGRPAASALIAFLRFVEQSPAMSPSEWREAIEALGGAK